MFSSVHYGYEGIIFKLLSALFCRFNYLLCHLENFNDKIDVILVDFAIYENSLTASNAIQTNKTLKTGYGSQCVILVNYV